jgi:uncharacterized protein (DUF2062 family)
MSERADLTSAKKRLRRASTRSLSTSSLTSLARSHPKSSLAAALLIGVLTGASPSFRKAVKRGLSYWLNADNILAAGTDLFADKNKS